MSNYYTMRDAKVRIAHELMNRGWNVEGYHADESDSMTDYYSPAYWNGIATKNGYILVIDNSTAAEAREITRYNYNQQSFADREKISKLEQMTVERGATAGEEANAKALIEKIKNKESENVSTYEVIGMTTAHMANPGKCKWHIEKDGKIYDKGTGITKYADMPEEYMYDIIKMEYKDDYKYTSEWGYVDNEYQPIRKDRTITDEQRKIINDFKALILRFERVVMGLNSCGDGTAETEATGKEQQEKQGYEKILITEYKTEIKVNELEKPETIEEGIYFILKTSFTNGCSKGSIYKIVSAKDNYIQANRMNGKLTKILTGRATAANTFNVSLERLNIWINKGCISICELIEVNTPYEVEKWEKIDKTKKVYNTTEKVTQEETKDINSMCNNCECFNNDCKGMSETYTGCVYYKKQSKTQLTNKIEYTITEDTDTRDNSALWVVKIINTLSKEDYIKVSEQFKALKGYYSKFKHGFIFKYNPSEKLADCITGTTTETTEQQEKPNKAQETANEIIDKSTDIITELNLKPTEYTTNEQYKNMLVEYLQNKNITITDSILNYIEYEGLKQVLQTIKTESEQKKQQEEQQAEKAKLLEKINSSIDSLQSKIDSISGDYKTNTYKRMQEQASRDSKKESLEIDIKLLEYVKQKLIDNEPITAVEKGLTVGAFRDMIHQYYITKYGRYPKEIKFPAIDYSIPLDGWYNKEVPQKQKKLQKYSITNSIELNTAIDEYKNIYDNKIDRSYKNPLQQQIKKLENEYKLRQKGDINFTPAKVVERLIDYAQIDNNSIVLEPSAGIGNIADKIKAITENVDCIEYMNHFSELLKMKKHNVIGNDILQYNRLNYYDAVIMNPPFSEEIDHIKQAYKTLKVGGKLISITSPSWTFNSNKKAQEFREWFNSVGGEILEELESGTFEMTGVRTLIIEINKEEETRQEAI